MWISINDRFERWDLEGFPEIITDELPEGETAQTPTYFWQLKKIAEIKTYYDQLSQTFTYQNHTYQTDKEAELNLSASLTVIELGTISSIIWRTLDNQMVEFTSEAFKTFCTAVFEFKQNNFMTKVHHIDNVRALTTVEEVENYDFTTGN